MQQAFAAVIVAARSAVILAAAGAAQRAEPALLEAIQEARVRIAASSAAAIAAPWVAAHGYRHEAGPFDADFLRDANRHAAGARDVLNHRVRDLAVNCVRLLHAFRVGNLLADRVLFDLAHLVRNLLADRMGNHAAHLIRNLLDLLFDHGFIDGVGNLLDAGFLHHLARGVRVDDLVVGAFLEVAPRAVALVAFALVVHISAASTTGRGVRNHRLLDCAYHAGDVVRHQLAGDCASP